MLIKSTIVLEMKIMSAPVTVSSSSCMVPNKLIYKIHSELAPLCSNYTVQVQCMHTIMVICQMYHQGSVVEHYEDLFCSVVVHHSEF